MNDEILTTKNVKEVEEPYVKLMRVLEEYDDTFDGFWKNFFTPYLDVLNCQVHI